MQQKTDMAGKSNWGVGNEYPGGYDLMTTGPRRCRLPTRPHCRTLFFDLLSPSVHSLQAGHAEQRTLKCGSGTSGGLDEMSLRSGPASEIRVDDMSRAIGQSDDYVWRPPAKPLSISECALTSPPHEAAQGPAQKNPQRVLELFRKFNNDFVSSITLSHCRSKYRLR